MVVKCPNCDYPNDADMEKCARCAARIPFALRQKAMVPKRQGPPPGQLDQARGDALHQKERGQVVKRNQDDLVGRRPDIQSLRGEIKPIDGHIGATSPADRYGPPPAHVTATRNDSGRAFIDADRYREEAARAGGGAAAPAYADPAAWAAQQPGAGLPSQSQTEAALHAAGQALPGAALQAHQAQASRGAAPFQGPGAAPVRSGQAAPGIHNADTEAWRGQQLSVPRAEDTANALGISQSADPNAVVQGLGGARQRSMPAPPPRQGAGRAMPAPPPRAAARPPASQEGAFPPPSAEAPGRVQSGVAIIRDSTNVPAPSPVEEAPAANLPDLGPGPRLVFLTESGQVRDQMPLRPGRTIFGRSEGEVLLSNDPFVSPWHAQLHVRRNGAVIKDMFSRNGIFLRIHRQTVLQDDDRFLIGRQLIRFRCGWREAEADAQGTRAMGGANPSAPARVMVMTDADEIAQLVLIREVLTIGRAGCHVNIPEDDRLADKHVQIQFDGRTFFLIDLNAPGGVFIAIRGDTELRHGDEIQIGRQRLRLEWPALAAM